MSTECITTASNVYKLIIVTIVPEHCGNEHRMHHKATKYNVEVQIQCQLTAANSRVLHRRNLNASVMMCKLCMS